MSTPRPYIIRDGVTANIQGCCALEYNVSEKRLKLAVQPERCFLVVGTEDEDQHHLGYLLMHLNQAHQIATVEDMLVTCPSRQQGIGSKLLQVAQQWGTRTRRCALGGRSSNQKLPCDSVFFA